jgi:2-polyprenyl-3-methyl-5-hydroxy-6-metoxy-1,4-benzoquinol methylase
MEKSSQAEVLDSVISELKPCYPDELIVHYLTVHSHRYKFDIAAICEMVPKGASIFDFGAHPYATSEALSRLGYAVTAADRDPSNVNFADKLSFPIVACDANTTHIPIDDATFDAVVLTEVFEHLHLNPIVTIRELLRVLKPGGILYLTTPNGLGLRKLAKVLRKGKFQEVYTQWAMLEPIGIMGHVTEYTPSEIQDFLERSGFKSVSTRTENVYKKSNKVEHYFWKTVSFPFRNMRETIISVARK